MIVTEGEADPPRTDQDGSGGHNAGEHGNPERTAASLPPRAAAVVRRRRVEARQRRLTRLQTGISVLFVVLLVGLVFVGYQATLKVGGGTDSRITDPAEPGYLADPIPTPVDAYVAVDGEGKYVSSLIVAPDGSGAGGTVVPIGTILAVGDPDSAEADPVTFVRDVYNEEGIEAFRSRLGSTLGFAIGSVREVPHDALVELADGEPVTVENPDNLIMPGDGEGAGEVRYPAGTLTLQPEDIAEFLAFEGADDPAPNQQIRVSQVWEELLARADGRTHDDLPEGESTDGAKSPPFGEMVDVLGAGDVSFDAVPLYRRPIPGSIIVVAWMADPAYLDNFVARVVPLPVSPVPGRRTPVAILNGTSDRDAVSAAVPKVVSAGGEVSVVGNADSFDVASTTVEYLYPDAREAADAVAGALGVTATEGSAPQESEMQGVSVKVVLGSDTQQ
jgi:hypothetical protein